MQKGQLQILILVGVLVILGIGGAYYLGRQASPRPSPPSVASQTPQPLTSPADETANWKTYKSPTNYFSFKYPSENWTVYDGNGLVSITCVSQDCNKGNYDNFKEIYINPVSINTLDDYIDYLNKLGSSITDKIQTKFLGLDAIKAAYPGSKQSGSSELKIFVVNKGRGYEIIYFYPKLDIKQLNDFAKPDPDILSTFRFLK